MQDAFLKLHMRKKKINKIRKSLPTLSKPKLHKVFGHAVLHHQCAGHRLQVQCTPATGPAPAHLHWAMFLRHTGLWQHTVLAQG